MLEADAERGVGEQRQGAKGSPSLGCCRASAVAASGCAAAAPRASPPARPTHPEENATLAANKHGSLLACRQGERVAGAPAGLHGRGGGQRRGGRGLVGVGAGLQAAPPPPAPWVGLGAPLRHGARRRRTQHASPHSRRGGGPCWRSPLHPQSAALLSRQLQLAPTVRTPCLRPHHCKPVIPAWDPAAAAGGLGARGLTPAGVSVVSRWLHPAFTPQAAAAARPIAVPLRWCFQHRIPDSLLRDRITPAQIDPNEPAQRPALLPLSSGLAER
jgi:hypothetical protein